MMGVSTEFERAMFASAFNMDDPHLHCMTLEAVPGSLLKKMAQVGGRGR